MFSDPLKLLPFAIFMVAAAGLFLGKLSANEAIGLMSAGGLLHSGISAINNVNPPK